MLFSIKPIFLETQEKDNEKEQKQSLYKREQCTYALYTVLNQQREQKLSSLLRPAEHSEQWRGHVHETKPQCILVSRLV